MESKSSRSFVFNSVKRKNENKNYGKPNFKHSLNIYLNLPIVAVNAFEGSNPTTNSIDNLKKQIFQSKININKKKKELQILKIQYNKLLKENRTYKKLIFEVLDLHDEAKNNIDKLDNKEKILDSSYISEEQLLNKINICKIDAKQEKELKNSFEMINLKEELSSKRKLLLNKRKEYDDLKQGITIKNMNEMNSKLESIRVNEIKLQNEVTSSQEKLIKNTEITHKLEKDIESQEKINEELSKQEADYEKRYSSKLNEVKEIEKDIGSIESRRKNKITKITNNVNFSGGKLKGIRLKSKIFKIKNDINKIQEYKSNERDDLIKKLEQKRAIVSELKKTNLDLETKIKDLEIKNTQLYVEVNKNIQEKSILENRGKEQMKDLKKIKELEKTIYELKMVKDKLIKDFEERQKYLNDMKKTDKKVENNNDKENDKLETIKE
jgi:chromosome segregation ATPase